MAQESTNTLQLRRHSESHTVLILFTSIVLQPHRINYPKTLWTSRQIKKPCTFNPLFIAPCKSRCFGVSSTCLEGDISEVSRRWKEHQAGRGLIFLFFISQVSARSMRLITEMQRRFNTHYYGSHGKQKKKGWTFLFLRGVHPQAGVQNYC